jgi:hypothetical protein
MDLDREYSFYNKSKDVTLVMLVAEWLQRENFSDFSMVYPRENDTIMEGYEGSIRYDHHNEGYATIVSIHSKYAYIDYDGTTIDASDPEFFPKLKGVLLRHQAVHANCKHIRSIND